jgi:hypothetical protein
VARAEGGDHRGPGTARGLTGVPFVLEVGAGANAKGVAEAFERAKATA